ncbi:c-type cytochrome biogenesis protein CcmI [Litorivivens sp.]|uniref:c-type cytochrome biogenesis protein CcmI n=1 Tax=Litorivivens sp. TaxID=2020868 RepID=UPI003562843F
MTELFVTLALALVIFGGAIVWSLRARSAGVAAGAANAAVFKQRLEELKAERERGDLDDEALSQLEAELQRQLLAETVTEDSAARQERLPAWLLPLLLVLSVGASAMLYRSLGAWPEMAVNELQAELAGKRRFSPEDIRALSQAIETSLQFRSENPELRFWHAQLAIEQGNYSAAVASYRELLAGEPRNAMLMAQLAQALFLRDGRKLDGEARALMEQAIALDPAQTTALGMLGMDAFERGDYAQAVQRWTALLSSLSPQSPQSQVIGEALARAKQLALENGTLGGIVVSVDRADSVSLPDQGVLYVFAKAADGPGFPLAVVRKPQSGDISWPQQFVLTPADAMRADMTLDKFEDVKLTARFSRGGSVAPTAGDVEGHSAQLRWRSLEGPVSLVLDSLVE